MIVFVFFFSLRNFYINIFILNINGYLVIKIRVVLVFMNYSLCWKFVVYEVVVYFVVECIYFSEVNFSVVKRIKIVWLV